MLESGAAGFLDKSAGCEELVRAIRIVSRGKHYLSPESTDVVVESYVGRKFPTNGSAYSRLGTREREVLQLLAEGRTSRQIASRMCISTKTVEAHRRNIMRKLNLHSVADLTKYAIREGLTDLG